jgi:hypothetical protein
MFWNPIVYLYKQGSISCMPAARCFVISSQFIIFHQQIPCHIIHEVFSNMINVLEVLAEQDGLMVPSLSLPDGAISL